MGSGGGAGGRRVGAASELSALYETFGTTLERVTAAPASLDELGEQLKLVARMQVRPPPPGRGLCGLRRPLNRPPL